ncbi:uncharacterized protein LOC123866138 isoform X2 [Maniola jurtina]|uniref:uncharacterized protein LOC123866138 isoform X2 n=1 Tax=Maniola jurtina TaxID=191418 RepID=UPI001E68FD93|nr:uncharacterized protein LOC123866138 isoform X2 [Maniola jurtina]
MSRLVFSPSRAVVVCAATAYVYMGAHAQPLTCKTDDQCETGYYCDRDVAYVCRPCLDCELLKRSPPLVPSQCIKSVAECGSCITGLVEDIRGDVTLQCVAADAHGHAAVPAYVWGIIGVVALLLFALVVFIVTYVLRNTYTFKILAMTGASVQSTRGAGAGLHGGAASAPEMPPPYDAHYIAVPPHSPEQRHDETHNRGDEEWPFIKRTPSGHSAEQGGARESADSQEAVVYNSPYYVRGSHLPLSYDGAGLAALSVNDEERDMLAVDDETVASTWTPGGSHGDSADSPSGAASELSAQLAAARATTLVCQDSNNNRNASGADSGAAGPSGAPRVYINVVQTIHTTQPPPRHHEPSC